MNDAATGNPANGGDACTEVEDLDEPALRAQYSTLVDLVIDASKRLDRLAYLFVPVELALLFFFVVTADSWQGRPHDPLLFVDLRLLPAFVPLTAMFLAFVWIALALRVQMSLRLLYFQLRAVERSLGVDVYGPFLATERYWAGQPLSCRDGGEKIAYPDTTEGRVGRIASRVWTWLVPAWFFFLALFCFVGWMANLHRYVN
jgi:hypothetical protein